MGMGCQKNIICCANSVLIYLGGESLRNIFFIMLLKFFGRVGGVGGGFLLPQKTFIFYTVASSKAATEGNTLPSNNSSDAPPPVEI